MLSVAKLTPGQEGYYERSVAAGLDDYYAGRGESPGVWTGRGAGALELEGVVQEGELGTADPRRPPAHRGAAAHATRRRGLITIERIDPLTDERSIETKKLAPVAGFDLVFSPPKSVSLLHALGDEETRRAVNEAHLSAWQAALAYLEDEACVDPPRHATASTASTRGGFVAAAYQHRTSRAQDPHLHTHVIVANMAQTPERRQVARARRRADPQDLPARRRLPLPGPPARRAHPHARRRVGDAAQGHGRAAGTSRAR